MSRGADTLVESKFFRPRTRAGALARTRLTDRLDRSDARVVLVSAPAGFGKTTLLGRWLSRADPAAWVSLDSDDREPRTFWTCVATALDRAAPGTGAAALATLRDGQAPVGAVVAAVLNGLTGSPGDLILALDDYHLADGPDLRPGMEVFVERLPPQVRLVVSTRADPGLPLARLRARGDLTEIRAADLRFTGDEAHAYLTGSTGLPLTTADVATLTGRTEGWAAALQLAALSLRGRDDVAGFVGGFAGAERFVVDYLVEEVLDRQPAEVRRFLLETSVLDRLTADLCDAVTTARGLGGRAMLDVIDRANLFLVPLDDRRRWYRYHHLFRDVLHDRLRAERGPDEVAALHRRAGDWHDRAGDLVPAVRHLLAAGDPDRAAGIVELAVPELRRRRQEATLRRWIDDLPAEVVAARPVLAVGLVGALMTSNEFGDVERRLREAEQALDGEPTVSDRAELARLPGSIAMYRAALALVGGDLAAVRAHADRATRLAPPGDHLTQGAASALTGLAAWTAGDLPAAHRGYSAAAAGLGRAGHVADVLGCSITLADLEITQGRLGRARETFEAALRLAAAHGPALRGTADMHVGLSRIAYERDDLPGAAEHLRRCEALGDEAGLPQNPYRWRVASALLHEARGDRDTALALLDDAERVYVADLSPDVRPVPALRARMLAAHGDVAAALAWARRRHLSPGDDVPYLHEYEYLTLARILLAGGSRGPDVLTLLERLRAGAEAGGRTGTVIEILVVLALAHRAAGRGDAARASLAEAVERARPEGHLRVFTAEGDRLTPLLRDLSPRGPAAGRPPGSGLPEPLSARERDVLRLLAGDLDGPGIARTLVVSLNTVRTHTRHIYTKLGVTNRRAAVRRARELGLLGSAGGL